MPRPPTDLLFEGAIPARLLTPSSVKVLRRGQELPTPRNVKLLRQPTRRREDALAFEWTEDSGTAAVPRDLLESFIALTTDEQLETFARQYGPLGVEGTACQAGSSELRRRRVRGRREERQVEMSGERGPDGVALYRALLTKTQRVKVTTRWSKKKRGLVPVKGWTPSPARITGPFGTHEEPLAAWWFVRNLFARLLVVSVDMSSDDRHALPQESLAGIAEYPYDHPGGFDFFDSLRDQPTASREEQKYPVERRFAIRMLQVQINQLVTACGLRPVLIGVRAATPPWFSVVLCDGANGHDTSLPLLTLPGRLDTASIAETEGGSAPRNPSPPAPSPEDNLEDPRERVRILTPGRGVPDKTEIPPPEEAVSHRISLIGALTLALMRAVTTVTDPHWSRCSLCRHPYQPSRKVVEGRKHYCTRPDCKVLKNRLATRKCRRKKRQKQKTLKRRRRS